MLIISLAVLSVLAPHQQPKQLQLVALHMLQEPIGPVPKAVSVPLQTTLDRAA
ncbi:hypothetical protein [Brucella pseudogrignonensis]|uniref:hypothetical protein n=1 Tax=Brucella pseudogrignonensis TaxID=419475 RepID=UPI003D9853D0